MNKHIFGITLVLSFVFLNGVYAQTTANSPLKHQQEIKLVQKNALDEAKHIPTDHQSNRNSDLLTRTKRIGTVIMLPSIGFSVQDEISSISPVYSLGIRYRGNTNVSLEANVGIQRAEGVNARSEPEIDEELVAVALNAGYVLGKRIKIIPHVSVGYLFSKITSLDARVPSVNGNELLFGGGLNVEYPLWKSTLFDLGLGVNEPGFYGVVLSIGIGVVIV